MSFFKELLRSKKEKENEMFAGQLRDLFYVASPERIKNILNEKSAGDIQIEARIIANNLDRLRFYSPETQILVMTRHSPAELEREINNYYNVLKEGKSLGPLVRRSRGMSESPKLLLIGLASSCDDEKKIVGGFINKASYGPSRHPIGGGDVGWGDYGWGGPPTRLVLGRGVWPKFGLYKYDTAGEGLKLYFWLRDRSGGFSDGAEGIACSCSVHVIDNLPGPDGISVNRLSLVCAENFRPISQGLLSGRE